MRNATSHTGSPAERHLPNEPIFPPNHNIANHLNHSTTKPSDNPHAAI